MSEDQHITAPQGDKPEGEKAKPDISSHGQAVTSSEAKEKVADDLVHKFIDVEQQPVTAEDNIPMQVVNLVEGEGRVKFPSEGEEKVLTIRPEHSEIKYKMILLDDKGTVLQEIPMQGISKTRIRLLRGNYDIVLRTDRGENIPFIIQSDV